jgi:deoxycytidylate deaminase
MMEAIAMGHRQQWADRMVVLGTYSPCSFCANVLVDAGLVHVVVYDVLTEHDKRGVEILNRGLPDGAVSLANLTSKRIESWV